MPVGTGELQMAAWANPDDVGARLGYSHRLTGVLSVFADANASTPVARYDPTFVAIAGLRVRF